MQAGHATHVEDAKRTDDTARPRPNAPPRSKAAPHGPPREDGGPEERRRIRPCKPRGDPAHIRRTDSWPSGRRRTPGKCVGGKPSRGFESLTVRHPDSKLVSGCRATAQVAVTGAFFGAYPDPVSLSNRPFAVSAGLRGARSLLARIGGEFAVNREFSRNPVQKQAPASGDSGTPRWKPRKYSGLSPGIPLSCSGRKQAI